MNWNLTDNWKACLLNVAPFTGAWIETQCHHITHHQTNLSHPLRVRELKRHPQSTTPMAYRSHPLRVRELKHRHLRSQKTRRRRTLYGCVNWNFVLRICSYQFVWSHPLRVRELKQQQNTAEFRRLRSHPLRVRELKQSIGGLPWWAILSHPLRVRELKHTNDSNWSTVICRTLYGCVNWNSDNLQRQTAVLRRTLYGCVNWNFLQHKTVIFHFVAPFTGAWIETRNNVEKRWIIKSHPLRVRELKLRYTGIYQLGKRRTLYGCVNWNPFLRYKVGLCACRTLYGCVNWNAQGIERHRPYEVAPFTGAWIETSNAVIFERPLDVAPFTGAWIETRLTWLYRLALLSHPLRVRELKRLSVIPSETNCGRTLYGCVNWNPHTLVKVARRCCRTLYGCVNWNFILFYSFIQKLLSHPLRVRELKRNEQGYSY